MLVKQDYLINFIDKLSKQIFFNNLLTKHVAMKTFLKAFLLAIVMIVFTVATYSQKIYVEEYESQADISVYVEEYESQCDLKVYVVQYESKADEDGLWYFEEYESQADLSIYFEEYESQADLKIYFVEYESQAGWRNFSKQHLLRKR